MNRSATVTGSNRPAMTGNPPSIAIEAGPSTGTGNRPATVTGFINAAHFIDHYAMLIFAAAVIVIGPALRVSYSQLLPYATPAFVAFGAGSLLTGWLGDRWSRRHMMAVFFLGIGAAMIGVGLVRTEFQLGLALLAVGVFASIYHPVGTAMLVSYASRLGRQVGLNGVWGNLGVASSALVTGSLCQYLGWRWAFIVPGLVTIGVGLVFMRAVRHEARTGVKQAAMARVAKESMWRVVAALAFTIIASSTTFNAITVALPKMFAERLAVFGASPFLIGLAAAGVYVFGALMQFAVGHLIDRHSLKHIFLPLAFAFPPLLYVAAGLSGSPFILAAIGIVAVMFGLVTVNDAMIGKYTSDEWRARAYALRYFLGFTAAGASVGLVAWLHDTGGFGVMLEAFSAFCLVIVAGAVIFPPERRVVEAQAAE
jgi:MFS family permease